MVKSDVPRVLMIREFDAPNALLAHDYRIRIWCYGVEA
jgi:hypothetical protein